MFPEVRQQEIYKVIREQKKIKVCQLAKDFGVTLETIRNDLSKLELQGLINRCHGGAVIGKQEIRKLSKFNEEFDVSYLLRDLLIKKEIKVNSKKYKGKVCILGSFVIDIIASVDRYPNVGEIIYSNSNTMSPGGKGTNQALAASYSQAKVHLVTKVGNDHFKNYAYKYLQESGIDSFTIFESDSEPTGSSVTYLANKTKDNLTATYLGANDTFIEQEIDISLPYISESDVLLIQGEININALLRATKFAHEIGKTIILNVAPYNKELKKIYEYVDFITFNVSQASAWTKMDIDSIESGKKALDIISGDQKKKVIINLDELGIIYFDGKNKHHVSKYRSLMVDKMGAYDAFNGAFASQISIGKTIDEAVLFGSAFLSVFVEKKGVTNMPDISSVLARLKPNNVNNIKWNPFSNKSRC